MLHQPPGVFHQHKKKPMGRCNKEFNTGFGGLVRWTFHMQLPVESQRGLTTPQLHRRRPSRMGHMPINSKLGHTSCVIPRGTRGREGYGVPATLRRGWNGWSHSFPPKRRQANFWPILSRHELFSPPPGSMGVPQRASGAGAPPQRVGWAGGRRDGPPRGRGRGRRRCPPAPSAATAGGPPPWTGTETAARSLAPGATGGGGESAAFCLHPQNK